MTENSITYKAIQLMNGVPGVFARKRHGGRFGSGDPDIAGVVNGNAFFCEMKVTGGELTKLQATMLDNWRKSGAKTYVAVYDFKTKDLRVISLHHYVDDSGENWIDFAGPVNKIEGGYIRELNFNGIFPWMQEIG